MVFIFMKVEINKLKEVCKNSKSMAEAARILGLNYKTLRRYTEQLGIFKPNPSGFGMNIKKEMEKKFPLNLFCLETIQVTKLIN